MIFLSWIKQKVTNGLRILFPEPKANSRVTEEDMDKFVDKYEPAPRSSKGKEKVMDGVGESSVSIEVARLRGIIKERGNKINELTNELDKANSTIDKYNAKTKEIMIRDEKAATLLKDQRNAIDDLTSKLQRSSEENKELVSRVDTMSKQVLSKGIISDNEKIKELEGRLDKTTEYLARSKRNLDEKADEINTLTFLNERLVFELGQAKEVNEDCDVEIEELKSKVEEHDKYVTNSTRAMILQEEELSQLQDKITNQTKIRKELENKLLTVSSTEGNTMRDTESIIKEKDTEIKDLKEANITLKKDVINLTSKLNTMTSLHTERSRNEELGRKKIIEINNDFTIREVKFVKEVVSKVYEYKEALGESAIIAESILINNSKALEHEKLYTANKLKEDLRNQRLFESEVNDSQTKLSQVYERITVIDRELRETVKNINISNENYSEQINAIYTGMEEQKLVIEKLVLTPIEKFIVNSPVSFQSKLSKVKIVKSYTESNDLMANITRSQRGNSTESSPASSPMSSHTSTPSSSPRGEKDNPTLKPISKVSKGDSTVIQETLSFLKPISPLSKESKTKESVKAKPKSEIEAMRSTLKSTDKTKITIPKSELSNVSRAFKPSEHTFTLPIEEKKNTTHTASNNDID